MKAILVNSCKECPHVYGFGCGAECSLINDMMPSDPEEIREDCPLTDTKDLKLKIE